MGFLLFIAYLVGIWIFVYFIGELGHRIHSDKRTPDNFEVQIVELETQNHFFQKVEGVLKVWEKHFVYFQINDTEERGHLKEVKEANLIPRRLLSGYPEKSFKIVTTIGEFDVFLKQKDGRITYDLIYHDEVLYRSKIY